MRSSEVNLIATRVGHVAEAAVLSALKSPTANYVDTATKVRSAVEECVRDNLTTQGNLL